MEELTKQLVTVFGTSIVFLAGAAWLLKIIVLEALKRDFEEMKKQGKRELAEEKQRLDIEKKQVTDLRTEFMAEAAIRRLLECPGWEQRSFSAIQKRLGGFGEDELRKLLVRSGAIQFWGKVTPDGHRKELWGLLSKNELRLPKGHQEMEEDETAN